MKTDDWKRTYENLIERLPIYVQDARLTICGLSTFVDGYVRLHEAELLSEASEGTPQAALAQELFRRASAGIGGEFYMAWPEGGTWVEKKLQISRWGVGGTGAQAAQTLAILGAPALMSLEDRSQRQLSVIHPNILVATKEGLVKCGELPMTQGGKSAHYIFEFTAGTQVGSVVLRRSSRTIVRFGDERLDNDPDFARESITAAATAGAIAAVQAGIDMVGKGVATGRVGIFGVVPAHACRRRAMIAFVVRIGIHGELASIATLKLVLCVGPAGTSQGKDVPVAGQVTGVLERA